MSTSLEAPIAVLHVDAGEGELDATTADFATGMTSVTVESARTAAEGLDRLADGTFDCIVSEYRLPDEDGITLLERVRSEHPDLPFVLFTEHGNERVASEAIAAGVTEYVPSNEYENPSEALADAVRRSVERHQTARDLRESEERYRTLVERSHDGIYIYQDDEFVFVDERISEISGYSLEELYEIDIWELIHPADRDRVQRIGNRRRRDEDAPTTYDARIQTKDGETRYLEFSVQSITHEGEWAALGTVRDVTERRQRERELEGEQEFIRTILNTLEDVIFVFTLDGEMIRWNDRLVEVTGYDDEELAEMNAFDLLAPEYYDSAVYEIRDAVSSGSGVIEAEVVTSDGERRPFEFRGSTLSNSDGDVVAIAGVARDVSERRRREEELIQYQTIVEAVGDPVYTLDENGAFTFVNDALVSTVGYSEAELLGEHVSKIIRDEDVETAESLIEDLLQSDDRTRATFEMEAVTADGEHVPCEDHMAILPSADEFRGTAGVVRDISDRKEREERLRRQNEQLDQFASVVSHDLRNPLNVIMGRLDLARETDPADHLDAIERSAMRMSRMIDDLLTLARDGQTVGDVEPVDLEEAIEDAWRNVETRQASLAVEDDLGTVRADEARLASLFENLFRNAIEHGGEAVTVRVGPVRADGTDRVVGFYVEDDGPGIAPEAYSEVFEHGYSSSADGTGLGLVIVDGIADAHDWDVSVTDGPGGGARFEILVGADEERPERRSEPRE